MKGCRRKNGVIANQSEPARLVMVNPTTAGRTDYAHDVKRGHIEDNDSPLSHAEPKIPRSQRPI
jgi:hypothetical protein